MSSKAYHESRDPLHVFIRFDTGERQVIASEPVQRLRHIHQLAMTYLVYPSATHKRFEHSLGVMELAGRVFDSVVRNSEDDSEVRDAFPDLKNPDTVAYWRRVLRIAALTHDIGHLPFSHAAEKELLPAGWTHERLTAELLRNSSLTKVLTELRPKLDIDDVVKLALGQEKAAQIGLTLSPWETFLAEIIVGDAFGVDRMDYLLRDSLHAGVAYGRFDHYRLIDTLRLLIPAAPEASTPLFGPSPALQSDPVLGVELGGLQSAEALLIARYMMYSQVYFHHVRRIYDIHLQEFLSNWLSGGKFSTDTSAHLSITDNEVNAAILSISKNPADKAHQYASRLIERQLHFKRLYSRNPGDQKVNPRALTLVYDAAVAQFGVEHIRKDEYLKGAVAPDFPVLLGEGQVVSSLSCSDILAHLPSTAFGYVFVSPDKETEAVSWLQSHKDKIVT